MAPRPTPLRLPPRLPPTRALPQHYPPAQASKGGWSAPRRLPRRSPQHLPSGPLRHSDRCLPLSPPAKDRIPQRRPDRANANPALPDPPERFGAARNSAARLQRNHRTAGRATCRTTNAAPVWLSARARDNWPDRGFGHVATAYFGGRLAHLAVELGFLFNNQHPRVRVPAFQHQRCGSARKRSAHNGRVVIELHRVGENGLSAR